MSYFESAEGEMITKARAMQELDRHGATNEAHQFLTDMGDSPTYEAQAVLAWLGY